MNVRDVHTIMMAWAPKEIAWERDNIGLQVGDLKSKITGILVCLDCTEKVVAEAAKRNANLIISHHPVLFRPPKSITPVDETGRVIRALIRGNINLYSAHTNLDFTSGGTSFALAEALGLKNVEFLHKSYQVDRKIVTFVPAQFAGKIRNAMSEAGAGVIGNYDQCSFEILGSGSFSGNDQASPTIGKKKILESVEEIRLEMIVKQWDVAKVVQALKSAHPYEEVAYDIYPLQNTNAEFGMGIIGSLPKPMPLTPFLNMVKRQLSAKMLRRTEGKKKTVARVAACGGAGGELVDTAIAREADVFITADVRYHEFHHAAEEIILIDAGHFETEHLVVKAVVNKLRSEFANAEHTIPVFASTISTNPIYYS
ncbi:MAG: Nif3-like dinuclear metal center hexameric protein [bacterium]